MTTPDTGVEYVTLARDVALRDGPTIPAGTVGYVIGCIDGPIVDAPRYRVRWLGLDAPAVHTSADLRPSTEAAWEAARAAKGTAPAPDAAPLGVERTASPDVAAIEARAAQVAHALETAQETRVLVARKECAPQWAKIHDNEWREASVESAADVPALLLHVRRLTAALADNEWREASVESAADVPALLLHVRRLTAALADSDARVASAVAAERDRCAAVCRRIAEDREASPTHWTVGARASAASAHACADAIAATPATGGE